ncbi:GntR family transcriptional regulator of vanillate catabolism [Rhizobium sp. SG_E_25_P2]|uniref:GntR family transcriptional regulator n=1 Tax=Rhizobium sp. SG_E_25_P2 TaxID=2879942 RepID=UPI002476C700|nr:GntR family transcriptional regulator [Rhizobium sp. SG_E_25_P2]MDH6267406.1 GntR family transcriptional regulator of vanillate catabolism [Rhizobium sp. SG_E_25_P2]
MSDYREQAPKQQTAKALIGLRDLVLTGQVEPGERLSEVALAERLNVSRTPLRAALQRMEQEGLITLIPSGGYAVRSFSRQDVIDAIELRGVLEGTAARLAAERGAAPQAIVRISAIVDQLDIVMQSEPQSMDFERYEALNGEFHRLLWRLAGSDVLQREIERMTSLPFASPNAFVNTDVDAPAFNRTLVVAQAQHRAIVSAIRLREGGRAEALAREHARLARQNLDFVLEEQPELRRKVAALALMAG